MKEYLYKKSEQDAAIKEGEEGYRKSGLTGVNPERERVRGEEGSEELLRDPGGR